LVTHKITVITNSTNQLSINFLKNSGEDRQTGFHSGPKFASEDSQQSKVPNSQF